MTEIADPDKKPTEFWCPCSWHTCQLGYLIAHRAAIHPYWKRLAREMRMNQRERRFIRAEAQG